MESREGQEVAERGDEEPAASIKRLFEAGDSEEDDDAV